MSNIRILAVDDEPLNLAIIEEYLGEENYILETAEEGERAWLALTSAVQPHDLVILDRMLPDFDGMEVCRQLRRERVGSRVLMLTAKDALGDKVGGLRAGADDYLTKPFSFDEFVARIEALLRRSDLNRHEPELRVADLTLNPATRRVARGDRVIDLTPKEYALLRYMMENAGTVLSRSQILNNNWGYGFDPGTKVVDVYIRYLRKKVDEGEATTLIHTVRGAGYRIDDRD